MIEIHFADVDHIAGYTGDCSATQHLQSPQDGSVTITAGAPDGSGAAAPLSLSPGPAAVPLDTAIANQCRVLPGDHQLWSSPDDAAMAGESRQRQGVTLNDIDEKCADSDDADDDDDDDFCIIAGD